MYLKNREINKVSNKMFLKSHILTLKYHRRVYKPQIEGLEVNFHNVSKKVLFIYGVDEESFEKMRKKLILLIRVIFHYTFIIECA